MRFILRLFTAFLFLFSFGISEAQDTTKIQTLSFSDITKRRGTYVFPEDYTKYRRAYMVYTLKCDPATTADGLDCGEWDYLTYTTVYYKDGVLDSTRFTRSEFTVNGASDATVDYSNSPIYDYYSRRFVDANRIDTTSLSEAAIGTGNVPSDFPYKSDVEGARSQYIWKASELTGAGFTAGDITGLRMNIIQDGGTIYKVKVKMAHVSVDSFSQASFEGGLQEVYYNNPDFNGTGWSDIQFLAPFSWDGTSNILVEFSIEQSMAGSAHLVESESTSSPVGLVSAGADYAVKLDAGGEFVNMYRDFQITGNAPRTVEAWGYTRQFNNAGLFEVGRAGATGQDFALRTSSTDDKWRVQHWGGPDYDFTAAGTKNAWRHYAVVYDGSVSRVYVDGVQVAQEASNLNTGAADVWLGRWQGSYYQGEISGFRMFDAAVPASVIQDYAFHNVDGAHPNAANLIADYRINEGMGKETADASGNGNRPGFLMSNANWYRIASDKQFMDAERVNMRPNIVFEQGVYTTQLDTTYVVDSVMHDQVAIIRYENPAPGHVIDDNLSNHPSLATDTLFVYDASMPSLTFDADGNQIASNTVTPDATLTNGTKLWYSALVDYEIGRFITPYGIGLDLGPNGTQWMYDVTDYLPLLQDSVELSAGNQQELIDLEFWFIEGEPDRDILGVSHIWGERASIRYSALDDDTRLSNTTMKLMDSAENFRVKMRITGHGHNSNDGSYPHCCEWRDNTHYLRVNGTLHDQWKIWQTNECAENNVYPQGGTWPGAREGWCPGDVVTVRDIEISEEVTGQTVDIDYDITPVPSSNQGMGNGNYVITGQLVQYGPFNRANDAEIYDIVNPNTFDYHGRFNPSCDDPVIILRNAGSEKLTRATIYYRVKGGSTETYSWAGSLKYHETQAVTLPINNDMFWQGDGSNTFEAWVAEPNEVADEYAMNDTMRASYELPDFIQQDFYIELRTNNAAYQNVLTVTDVMGNVVFQRSGMANGTLYRDTLNLDPGCYTLELTDSGNDGLYYWANTQQGSGSLRLRKIASGGNPYIKSFEPEFGRFVRYGFTVGYMTSVEDADIERELRVYPNPASDQVMVSLKGYTGEVDLQLVNMQGQVVEQRSLQVDLPLTTSFEVNELSRGMYMVNIIDADGRKTSKQVVVQ